jgi:hypothetical protein
MRSCLTLLLASVSLLAACAMRQPAAPVASAGPGGAASCERAAVPSDAVFGVRHGMDTATWPPKLDGTGSACQRVWFGDRKHPEAMQVLATYYYQDGHVRRLTGRVPGGQPYDCHYRDGELESARSQNAAQCPKASEIEHR